MKLKEKLYKWWHSPTNGSEELDLLELEEIATDFAIGFAEWCLKNGLFTQFKITQRANKELLEIYKQEKNL